MPKLLISISIIAFTLGLAVGCHSNDSPQKLQYFPVQEAPQKMFLLLKIEGKLALDKGSLRITHYFLFWQRYSELIIWPFGYSWASEGNTIWVISEIGDKVAKVGDSVKIGGGEISSVNDATGQEPPIGIQGPFWLMSGLQSQ